MSIGDGTLLGARLQPYRVAWRVTFRGADGQTIEGSIWTQQLRLDDLNGRKVLIRTAGTLGFRRKDLSIAGYIADINVLDAATLAPVKSEHVHFDGSKETLTFDGKHVEVRSQDPGGQVQTKTFETLTPAFDFTGGMWPTFFAAQRLQLGYSGVMPEFFDAEKGYETLPFRVVGRESVKAGSRGFIKAWIVECPDPQGGVQRFWISEAPPYLIRFTIPPVPGNPFEQTFEMLE